MFKYLEEILRPHTIEKRELLSANSFWLEGTQPSTVVQKSILEEQFLYPWQYLSVQDSLYAAIKNVSQGHWLNLDINNTECPTSHCTFLSMLNTQQTHSVGFRNRYVFCFEIPMYSQTKCLLCILFIRFKLYDAAVISLQSIATMFIIILCICMYISILLKGLCIYLIEHSSYWAAVSCSISQ